MIEKIKNLIVKVPLKVRTFFVYSLPFLILFLIFWLHDWHRTGAPNLELLLKAAEAFARVVGAMIGLLG